MPPICTGCIVSQLTFVWREPSLTTTVHVRPEDDNDTNRTAYLHRDRNYGEEWANLPPIIYELYPPANRRAVKPRDVLRDASNRIMLDPYDHPIRDFPGELPIVLSDTLHGVWVEYYLRSNREIKVYDLIGTWQWLQLVSMLTCF